MKIDSWKMDFFGDRLTSALGLISGDSETISIINT